MQCLIYPSVLGPLCAFCSSGYQLSSLDNSCVSCSGDASTSWVAFASVFGALFFAFGVYRLVAWKYGWHTAQPEMRESSSSLNVKSQGLGGACWTIIFVGLSLCV